MKLWRLFLLSFYTTVSFIPTVYGQNATTVTATGCVDVSGMQTCLNTANSKYLQCIAVAGDNEACLWAKDVDEIACYLESCWNKVYSCEYQVLVGGLLAEQSDPTTSDIPFWPAPANAPGGCSCNFGDIYQNVTASMDLIQTECPQYVSSGAIALGACQCCAWSAAVSAFYGICPGYDLTNYGLSTIDSAAVNSEGVGSSCAAINSSVCLGKFGIGSADDGTYIDPANLPSPGTKVLSTTEGPGPLTTPPGGATMTVTLSTNTYTITAAPYNSADVASGSTGSATSNSQGASGTASSTSASKTNSASAIRYAPIFGWILPALMFIV